MSTVPMPTYTPHAGSLAERVCTYFAANPEEALSSRDISQKFDVRVNDVQASLNTAVVKGALKRTKDELGWEYSAGPNLPGLGKPTAHQPFPAATAVRSRTFTRLAPIDVNAITVEDDVPLPAPRADRGTYAPLLDKLTQAGQSVRLPLEYKPTLDKAWRNYVKQTPGAQKNRYAVRAEPDGQHCRLFRTA